MNPPTTPNLPFFAYGTLLPGQPNYYLWQEAIVGQRPAIFVNGRLHDLGAYPILVEGGEGVVKGMVLEIETAAYEAILARLDYLEGYHPAAPDDSIYRRVVRPVELEGGAAVEAWLYVGRPEAAAGLPLIAGGDWVAYAAGNQAGIQAWWQGIITVGNE